MGTVSRHPRSADEPRLRAPEPISKDLDASGFSCGQPALDNWLRNRALKNEGEHSRTFVVCMEQKVVGYYCLSAGAVIRGDAPKKMQRNAPDQIPVVLIGRLAIDEKNQGQGIGRALLRDAVMRSIQAASAIGVRCIMVHALDEAAARFYQQYGFLSCPTDDRTLLLPIETAISALR